MCDECTFVWRIKCRKTTIGKILAENLKYAFYDLDEIIKERYNTIFEEFVQI